MRELIKNLLLLLFLLSVSSCNKCWNCAKTTVSSSGGGADVEETCKRSEKNDLESQGYTCIAED